MKSILRFFIVTFLLVVTMSKSDAQCTVSDIVIQNVRPVASTPVSCSVKFDVTFNIEDNNGNKLIFIHAWLQQDYPDYFHCVNGHTTLNGSIAAPSVTDLGNPFLNIGLNNNGAIPVALTSYPPDASLPLAAIDSAGKVLLPDGSANIILYGVVATTPVACSTPIVIVADLWSSQAANGQRAHCVNCGIRYSAGYLNTNGFVNCITLTYSGQIVNNTNSQIDGFYRVFADINNDGYFTPAMDTLIRDSTSFSVAALGATAISGPIPVANRNQNVFIVTTQTSGAASGASRVSLFRSAQCAALPVTFKSLNANRISRSNVMLKWETETEINNSGFSIERNTGIGWEVVAFITTQAMGGNSSSLLTYSFEDINSTSGVSQYRIRQIDFDGKSKLSDIRAVRGYAQTGKVIIYPNPSSNGSVSIVFEDKEGVRNVVLTDMNGKAIKQWSSVTGNTLFVEKLYSGVYFLRITGQETGVQKVEKIVVY